MELKEQPFAPTFAYELGEVPHVSGLLRRIAQLSGAGERVSIGCAAMNNPPCIIK